MIALKKRTKYTKAHHHSVRLMGCHFVITAVDISPQRAWDGIRAAVEEISRIELLISSWSCTSQTTEINNYAGVRPVKIDVELWQLIDRSIRVSSLTTGAFDISGTLSRYYWNFDGGVHPMLPSDKLESLRALIDYRNIVLDESNHSVYLKKKGMKIGFGGIGKGYAAYRAYTIMKSMGISGGLINASGDLMCWGSPPGASNWKICIPDPDNRSHSILEVSIPFGSVVTSGAYEKYTIIDGKRYAHIVDPRTGMPVTSLKSVSVLCPNPELGDALATALSVMGPKDGISLVNRLKGVECMFIDEQNVQHFSKNLNSTN